SARRPDTATTRPRRPPGSTSSTAARPRASPSPRSARSSKSATAALLPASTCATSSTRASPRSSSRSPSSQRSETPSPSSGTTPRSPTPTRAARTRSADTCKRQSRSRQRHNPDMRYENPLHLAEEVAALDLLSDQRIALGISRGSPEPALRGWEAFGYSDPSDAKAANMAREKFDRFLAAVRGHELAPADPVQFGPGVCLRIEPHSPGLDRRIWWGAGSAATAEWAAEKGVNM